MKYWEIIASRIVKAGRSLGWISAIDSKGRTNWVVDAHRGDGRRSVIEFRFGYAEHCSRSHDAVIRVYDDAGNVIETHEHKGDFKEW
jgi:hypothetical protein